MYFISFSSVSIVDLEQVNVICQCSTENFINCNVLCNLVKQNTCFKRKITDIDLIFTY